MLWAASFKRHVCSKLITWFHLKNSPKRSNSQIQIAVWELVFLYFNYDLPSHDLVELNLMIYLVIPSCIIVDNLSHYIQYNNWPFKVTLTLERIFLLLIIYVLFATIILMHSFQRSIFPGFYYINKESQYHHWVRVK